MTPKSGIPWRVGLHDTKLWNSVGGWGSMIPNSGIRWGSTASKSGIRWGCVSMTPKSTIRWGVRLHDTKLWNSVGGRAP